MNKIVITVDGETGMIAESSFSKEELEIAAADIAEDASNRDVFLDEREIIQELERKGYFKIIEKDKEVEIVQFYL